MAPLVGIIMGSSSDWETMKNAADTLTKLGVPHEVRVVSAHRTPDLLFEYAGSAEARDPFDYEFEVNGVQIVCLDSNRPARYAGGSVSDAQLDWLRAVCSASDPRPLVVAVHHNVLPMGSPFWDTFMRMNNGEAFHQALLLVRDRLRGVFFGHVHQNTSTVRDGILYSSVLSSWYQLHTYPGLAAIVSDRADPGFAVVTLTRTQTFIRYYRFDKPGERR